MLLLFNKLYLYCVAVPHPMMVWCLAQMKSIHGQQPACYAKNMCVSRQHGLASWSILSCTTSLCFCLSPILCAYAPLLLARGRLSLLYIPFRQQCFVPCPALPYPLPGAYGFLCFHSIVLVLMPTCLSVKLVAPVVFQLKAELVQRVPSLSLEQHVLQLTT